MGVSVRSGLARTTASLDEAGTIRPANLALAAGLGYQRVCTLEDASVGVPTELQLGVGRNSSHMPANPGVRWEREMPTAAASLLGG
jgi:hypothetical protein